MQVFYREILSNRAVFILSSTETIPQTFLHSCIAMLETEGKVSSWTDQTSVIRLRFSKPYSPCERCKKSINNASTLPPPQLPLVNRSAAGKYGFENDDILRLYLFYLQFQPMAGNSYYLMRSIFLVSRNTLPASSAALTSRR